MAATRVGAKAAQLKDQHHSRKRHSNASSKNPTHWEWSRLLLCYRPSNSYGQGNYEEEGRAEYETARLC